MVENAPEADAADSTLPSGLILALLPVWWLGVHELIAATVRSQDRVGVEALSTLVLNFAVVVYDSSQLRKAGVRLSAWWGLLIVPLYVLLRAVRARGTIWVPALFFVLTVVYAVGAPYV